MRVSSAELDNILGKTFEVLDHGFIRVIDYMGNDTSIVQAARVSYGSGTKTSREDKGLIYYLMKNCHTTPFEMCEIKFHIKLPIFVARQWVRHRTASINEYSARYSLIKDEYYIPDPANIAPQSKNNKQGRSGELTSEAMRKVQELLEKDSKKCYETYEYLLAPDINLARELARINLNLNYYTEWYFKINLHNLMHFLKLRVHPHAQYEIRIYAEKILEIAKAWCPLALAAFEEFELGGIRFSKTQIHFLKKKLAGKDISFEDTSLSKSEYNEIMELLK